MKPGQRIRLPENPYGESLIGTFIGPVDPDEVQADSRGRKLDMAWVRYDDGTTAKLLYKNIRPVADD